MVSERLARYQKTLARLASRHRKRELVPAQGIDFTSNDYLSLANASRIKDAILLAIENGLPTGSGGSRLLRGHHDVFAALESDAAQFFKSEQTLYFGSGYAANVALFSTLPQRNDLIIYDQRVHASILDGIAASRAEAVSVSHNDVECFANAIIAWRQSGGLGRPWLVVESLYSMDGDRAPLLALFELANAHDGFLVIDEAHATGVFGPDGRGLSTQLPDHENLIIVHTCGKSLGLSGAIVCLNKIFYDYLINRARTFIYSTAPSPLIAAGLCESLKILRDEPERRKKLEDLYTFANKYFNNAQGSQIIPVVVGKNCTAVRIANRLQAHGFDVRAIRPPTVPEGSARLRISITLNVTEKHISQLFIKLKEELS